MQLRYGMVLYWTIHAAEVWYGSILTIDAAEVLKGSILDHK